MAKWWDWWLWKPFVDFLRRWPQPDDVIAPPPSVWQKRSPYRGLVAVVFIFAGLFCLLFNIAQAIF